MLGMLPVVGCDTVGLEPQSPYLPLALPAFSIQPGSTADTSCASGVAFLASPHLTSLDVDFFQPDSTNPRQQCGAIAFDETGSDTGRIEIRQSLLTSFVGQWEAWGRRLRAASDGSVGAESFFGVKQIGPADTVPLSDDFAAAAPARDASDLVFFAYRHAPDSADAVDTATETNAAAQLWRFITAPDSFAVDSVDETHVLIRWANRHRDRAIDSTELWRRTGSIWQHDTTVRFDASQVTRTVTTWGTYRWIARHVTAYLDPPDVGLLAQPNSAFTPADSVSFDPPPPTGLLCEGNFSPTLDCRWWNAVASAPSVILRDSVIQDTLSGGAVNSLVEWTDSTVTSDSTYDYQVRHLVGGLTGRLSTPPHGATASPVAPENLNCAGTDETTISCVWVDKEPDTVAVERKVLNGDWTPLVDVLAGTMYLSDEGLAPKQHCYRVRHRRGTAYTAYGNEECAVPGDGDPLRPEP
jgi:hypothetical protein